MEIWVGIDVACRAAHQASCADATGTMRFVGHRFRTDATELEALWAKLPTEATAVTIVMEPTRNAWVPRAAWFRRKGARSCSCPPSNPLTCASTTPSTQRPIASTPGCLLGCRFCTQTACTERRRSDQLRR